MSGFDPGWLDLRAPADRDARNWDLVLLLAEWARERDNLVILDLGCGTGATFRALAPVMPEGTAWHLADHDPALLAEAERQLGDKGGGSHPQFHPVDLATGLDELVAHVAPDLITASALFDLASATFIDHFAARSAQQGAAVYAALTYDGRETWHPPHPLDDPIREAFLSDMRRDKGFGPALGADAADRLAAALTDEGYRVTTGTSDWQLAGDAAGHDLIAELADGIAAAVAPALGDEIAGSWRTARRDATAVTVGHRDILALPKG